MIIVCQDWDIISSGYRVQVSDGPPYLVLKLSGLLCTYMS